MNKTGVTDAAKPTVGEGAHAPPEDRLVCAFNQLRDELVSTLMFLLNNVEDAQDAAQEAFIKCWRTRDSLDKVHNLRAWIFRVGLNAARDLRRSAWNRKAKPLTGEEIMIADRETPPAEALLRQEDLSRLREAITHLRQEEKEVFLLRQNGGMTYEEIAEVRRSPVGTVKTQMRAALHKLRKVLN